MRIGRQNLLSDSPLRLLSVVLDGWRKCRLPYSHTRIVLEVLHHRFAGAYKLDLRQLITLVFLLIPLRKSRIHIVFIPVFGCLSFF